MSTATTTTAESIEAVAAAEPIPGESIQNALIDPEMTHRRWYSAEYGVRADDTAGVLHFFPSKTLGGWKADFPDVLKSTIDERLDPKTVSAGYTEELDSFYVVFPLITAANPWDDLEDFLDALDARLGS